MVLCMALLPGCIVTGGTAPNLPPVIELFTANPVEITPGGTATLSWSVKGGTDISIEPGLGKVESSGSVTVSPSQKQEYTLIASNQQGTVKSSLWVNVTADSQKPAALPVVNYFEARPGHGPAGIMVELAWDVEDADVIFLEWGENNRVDLTPGKGSIVQQPVVSTTYLLIARNLHGVRAVDTTVLIDRDPESSGGGDTGGSCG